jgi:hypothetical protein
MHIIPDIQEGTFSLGYFLYIANSRSGHNFIKKNIFSFLNDESISKRFYVNLENFSPKEFNRISTNLLPNDNSIYIISTRDLLNWYASGIRQKKKHNENLNVEEISNLFLTKWLEIANEYFNPEYVPEFIRVYYDDFVKSESYRRSICDKVNGDYNEDLLNFVTIAGGHSSFDGDKYQDRGSEMKVLERYKLWESTSDPFLLKLKEHPALEFYLKNFDVDKDKKKFIKSIK